MCTLQHGLQWIIRVYKTWSVTANGIGVGHVELGWTEFMGGELNRGRCYQHDRVQTALNVLRILTETAVVR